MALAIIKRAIEALRDGSGKIERLGNHHVACRAWKAEGNMAAEHTLILVHSFSWRTRRESP
jgi:hypothetical protein